MHSVTNFTPNFGWWNLSNYLMTDSLDLGINGRSMWSLSAAIWGEASICQLHICIIASAGEEHTLSHLLPISSLPLLSFATLQIVQRQLAPLAHGSLPCKVSQSPFQLSPHFDPSSSLQYYIYYISFSPATHRV